MSARTFKWCYDTLGVDERADWKTIQLAYRRKLHACHPDLRQDATNARDATEFMEVVEAYRALARYRQSNAELPPARTPSADIAAGLVSHTMANAAHGSDPGTGSVRRPFLSAASKATVTAFIALVSAAAATNYLDARGRAEPTPVSPQERQLALGMDPDDVLRVQGTPTMTRGSIWFYGESGVIFERGCVSGWQSVPPLPLRTPVALQEKREEADQYKLEC